MKQINLKTDSQFFRQGRFETKIFNGREIPVMKICKEDAFNESLFYALYSDNFNALPMEKDFNISRKYLCVTDRFFIIAERGESGFNTSFHYFSGEIKNTGDEIAITILAIDNTETTDAIYDKYLENEYSCTDIFNEHAASSDRNYNDCSIATIKMIEKTDFIRLPYNGSQRKLAANINANKLILSGSDGYKILETEKEAHSSVETGTLLYKRNNDIQNHLEIAKLINYAHDFDNEFWGVIETVYTYPADAEKIKSAYPEFYEKYCMSDSVFEKQKLLKNAKELPYIRENFAIGDGIIHLPIDTSENEITAKIEPFHFIMDREKCYSHLTRREKGYLRLNGMPLVCSLIEVNRRFKLVFYKTERIVKCGEVYYAELKFDHQSKKLYSTFR